MNIVTRDKLIRDDANWFDGKTTTTSRIATAVNAIKTALDTKGLTG